MRVSLKLKLAATFTILTVLAGSLAWLGIQSLGSFNTEIGILVDDVGNRLSSVDDLRSATMEVGSQEKTMILSTTPEEIRDSEAEVQKRRAIFLKQFESVQNATTEEVRQKLAGLTATWTHWTGLLDQERDLMERNRQADARALLFTESRQTRKDMMRQIDEIDGLETQAMKQAKEQAALQYNRAWRLLVGAAAAALLISIAAGVLLSLEISRGLHRAVSWPMQSLAAISNRTSRPQATTKSRTSSTP